jgi:hypothetical protein
MRTTGSIQTSGFTFKPRTHGKGRRRTEFGGNRTLDFHIKGLSELAEITKFDLDNRFVPYFVVNIPG